MKTAPFNLKKALAGHPLVTRDGKTVTDFQRSVIYLIGTIDGRRHTTFQENGNYMPDGSHEEDDLFLLLPATKAKRDTKGRFAPKQAEATTEESSTVQPAATAPEILAKAIAIMQERGKQYNQPSGERCMTKAVQVFNLIYGHNLKESEGWGFMAVLKIVRALQNPGYHADSYEDRVAYAALEAEAKQKETI